MAITGFFNKTADMLRYTDSVDEDAQAIRGFVSAGTFACCVQQASATERQIHGQDGVDVTHKLWMLPPTGFDLTHVDRIRVRNFRQTGTTTDFRVHSVNDLQNRKHHLQLFVQELIDDGT